MRDRINALTQQPIWLLFAAVVVVVSIYQLSQGQQTSGLFGILVAVLVLLSIAFQPPRTER